MQATASLPFAAARPAVRNRAPARVTAARDATARAAGDAARRVAAIAVAVNVALTVIDVSRIAAARGAIGPLAPALIAAAVALPLHLRHVVHALRGGRAPAGLATLALLAVVHAAAAITVGRGWATQLASLGVSVLVVVRGPRALGLVAAVALAPFLLERLALGNWGAAEPARPLPSAYLALTIVWRTMTQYVPVRLVAVIEALAAARDALEARAVLQARARIDGELRNGVGRALERIVARGERGAGALAAGDATFAAAELRRLVAESRHAASDARRVIAGYRTASLRAEVDAAAALLEAAGACVQVVGAESLPDAATDADERARGAIRAAAAQALRGEPARAYLLRVDRDAAGALSVTVTPDGAGAEARP